MVMNSKVTLTNLSFQSEKIVLWVQLWIKYITTEKKNLFFEMINDHFKNILNRKLNWFCV